MVPTIIGIIFLVVFIGSIIGGLGEAMIKESKRDLEQAGTKPTAMKVGFLTATKAGGILGVIVVLAILFFAVMLVGAVLYYLLAFIAAGVGVLGIIFLLSKLFFRRR